MHVSLGNHTETVDDVAQSAAAFAGPDFVLVWATAWPCFEVIQKGSIDVGNILVSVLSSSPPRSVGVWNSARVFNVRFLTAFFISFCVMGLCAWPKAFCQDADCVLMSKET